MRLRRMKIHQSTIVNAGPSGVDQLREWLFWAFDGKPVTSVLERCVYIFTPTQEDTP